MGMYTELIFGASLKSDIPEDIIKTIKYYLDDDLKEKPENLSFKTTSGRNPLNGSSYYFGVCEPCNNFFYKEISGNWVLSVRTNIKNYEGEIEQFLEFIKPYIESGSGRRDIYAITIYEEDIEPKIFYLRCKYCTEIEDLK